MAWTSSKIAMESDGGFATDTALEANGRFNGEWRPSLMCSCAPIGRGADWVYDLLQPCVPGCCDEARATARRDTTSWLFGIISLELVFGWFAMPVMKLGGTWRGAAAGSSRA